MKIATQTFGLSKEFSADLEGTIRKLYDNGFRAIEPFILFREKQGKLPKNLWAYDTLAAAWKTMQKLGMTIPSAHIGVGFGWFSMPVEKITKNVLMLHQRYGIRDFVISGPFGTPAQARHWASLVRRISDAVAPNGCRILYHNHDDEFRQIRRHGTTTDLMALFLEKSGPGVLLQLDVGWAGIAGDERRLVNRYAGRIASLHLKDFYPAYRNEPYTRKNMPSDAFAPVGSGAIAIREILSRKDCLPNLGDTLIIDQDKSSGEMLDALKTGRENIEAILKA